KTSAYSDSRANHLGSLTTRVNVYVLGSIARLVHSLSASALICFFFFFKQKTAYEIGLGIPAEPLFRSPRRNGERRRAPTASISKESPAITGVVEMVIRRPI